MENIYVLTEVAGRLDHLMANINTLYKSESILPDTSVFLLCSDSIAWLLKPGTYVISIPQIIRENKNWCSLVPIGAPAVVTTSGLKWNLGNFMYYIMKLTILYSQFHNAENIFIFPNFLMNFLRKH